MHNRSRRRLSREALRRIRFPITIDELPKELRGPSNNRFGGHKNRKLRGYWSAGKRLKDPGRVIDGVEREKIIQELRESGYID